MSKIIKIEPDWVCEDCIFERGARIPEGHLPTFHIGICGICGGTKEVTEPRDCGKTRGLLLIDKK
jgi:hypothetical protein